MNLRSYIRSVAAGIRGRATADYDGASQGRRLMLWNPGNTNINARIASSGDTLLNRSRDIVRKNPWASEIKAEWVSNAVGTGIVADFLHPEENVRKILMEGWKRFVDEADADGRVDLYGLQALVCGEVIEGAESITRLRPRLPRDGLLTPLKLQMMQSEHLPLTMNQAGENGNQIRCGIEFDKLGNRVAYHLYREHPGAGITALQMNPGQLARVPASAVIHTYQMVANGQIRGEPLLTRALTRLYQFDQFVDATLGRQKLGAHMVAWTTSIGSGEGGVLNARNAAPDGTTAPAGTRFGTIEPETIMQMDPGEELHFFEQPEISTQYEQFVSAQLREIFACAGMTLEMFDPSKVNFSSIRQGTRKYQRRCEQFQFGTICFQWNRPVANAWMDAYVLSGAAERIAERLKVKPIDIADYAENRAEYQAIEWRTPVWQWVDPLKDIMGLILEIRAGLKPLSVAIKERGYNPFDVLRQYAQDKELMEKYGLVFDTSAGAVTKTGAAVDAALADPDAPPPTEQEKALARALLQ